MTFSLFLKSPGRVKQEDHECKGVGNMGDGAAVASHLQEGSTLYKQGILFL